MADLDSPGLVVTFGGGSSRICFDMFTLKTNTMLSNEHTVKNGFTVGNSKSFKEVLALQFVEFFKVTPLHGCKYIVEPKRSNFERFFWSLIVVGGLVSSCYLMWAAWELNVSNPIITAVESTHHPIWNFRFPAVTLCPLNAVSSIRAKEWLETIELPPNTTKEEVYSSISSLATLIEPFAHPGAATFQRTLDWNNLRAEDVYQKLSVQCQDWLSTCRWKHVVQKCEHLFRSLRTSSGYCCSFNFNGAWVNDTEDTKSNKPKHPIRLSSCGFKNGISIVFKTATEDQKATTIASTGGKLLVHDPQNYPDDLTIEKLVMPGNVAYYSVQPYSINTMPSVRGIPVSKRRCYFVDERRIPPLSTYSYKNCILECRIRYIYELCQCVPFYFSHLTSLVMRVCNLTDVQCLGNNELAIQTIGRSNIPISEDTENKVPCGCEPQCDELYYRLEGNTGDLERKYSFNQNDLFINVHNASEHSVVHVYFNDLVATKYRRDTYYNWHDLLASFGGLLGLFIGFSLISGFEIIYFFTVRLVLYPRRAVGF